MTTAANTLRSPIEDLIQRYARSGVVIAVGAGLSVGSGLPSWAEVIRRLVDRCSTEDGEAISFDELAAEGFSLPAMASILEQHSQSPETFLKRLREELYRGFPFWNLRLDSGRSDDFVSLVQKNSTLRACAALSVNWNRETSNYYRNPQVHAIVNFNFDAVFREYVRHRYGHGIFRTIERPSAGSLPGRTPVYHMHGYFHFESHKIGNLREEAPDSRVFTEEEYFDFFNSPTSMFNYTFMHLLREHSMLFVGLSLQDYNIRRLLHYSRSERISADKREGKCLEEAIRRASRHYAIFPRGTDSIDRVREASLNRLGVRVVWVDDFNMIPRLFERMYASERADWSVVY
jgi:hypothetical protein